LPRLSSYFFTIVCAVAVAAGVVLWPHPLNQAPAKRPHFIDIAPRSNISYVTNNDFHDRKYFQQPMCGVSESWIMTTMD
jgi:hypothetical protein